MAGRRVFYYKATSVVKSNSFQGAGKIVLHDLVHLIPANVFQCLALMAGACKFFAKFESSLLPTKAQLNSGLASLYVSLPLELHIRTKIGISALLRIVKEERVGPEIPTLCSVKLHFGSTSLDDLTPAQMSMEPS